MELKLDSKADNMLLSEGGTVSVALNYLSHSLALLFSVASVFVGD